MDLFPTNLVDNLKVVKTQTANLPSDWAGAYISVETKDFPEKFMFNYSSSLGWNSNTTGQRGHFQPARQPRIGSDTMMAPEA